MSRLYDLGFLGGGQLARMSIQAAQRMGLQCISLDPDGNSPASQIAASIHGRLDDPTSIKSLLESCRFATLENEFIRATAVEEALEASGQNPSKLVPSLSALSTIQDKLVQRRALMRANVPCPRAEAIEGDGRSAVEAIGFPMALKARFGGYDGKGNRYADTLEEFQALNEVWGSGGWLAESFVSFRRELAAIVYVSSDDAGAFPTMETVQTNSVCDLVFPSGVDASAIAIAAVRAVCSNGGVNERTSGLFGVEMFEMEDGSILINELAPRPHNTGHYTLDWGGVSQFEQHVRLAMGWAPMQPSGLDACMANLLGQGDHDDFQRGIRAVLELGPNVHIHWYGKASSRRGRKMGHINAVGPDCVQRAIEARDRFYASV